jgi:hypothetical protein
MPKKLGGGAAWLDAPGVYHANITHVNEQPVTKTNNQPIDGWEVTFGVLHGEQTGKQFNLTFYNPNPNDTEEQQGYATGKQAALLIASGVCTEADLEKEIDVDLQQMTSRQVVIDLDLSKAKNPGDKQYIRLRFDRVFHVDDPRMERTPKSAEAIKLLPPSMRRKPDSFDLEKLGDKAASPSTNGKAAAKASHGVPLDDL